MTYPGTTNEVLLPLLERPGLKVEDNYFVAFSLEREDPANASFSTRTISKVVGGVTPRCGKLAVAAYGALVERVLPVSSALGRRVPRNCSRTFTAASTSRCTRRKVATCGRPCADHHRFNRNSAKGTHQPPGWYRITWV
jgi:hypothetical protein